MAEPDTIPRVDVNGKPFTRWTSAAMTFTMESIVNAFSFEHVEPPTSNADDVGINEGDDIKIYAGSEFMTAGYVDAVQLTETADDGLRVSVSGRTYTKDLYDTSAQHNPGEWEDTAIETIARELLEPYGIGLTVGADDPDRAAVVASRAALPFRRVTIEPGETPAEVLRRLARLRGLLLLAQPDGSLAITVAGSRTIPGRAERGRNIDSGATRIGDERDRFSSYRALGHSAGSSTWNGSKAAKSEGTAEDPQVRRYRPFVFEADGGETDLQDRAEWERNTRAARGRTADFPMISWYDPAGGLWRPNRLIDVSHPKFRIDGQVLISQVEMTHDMQRGNRCTISIVSPSAYDPERVPKTRANRRMWAAWE